MKTRKTNLSKYTDIFAERLIEAIKTGTAPWQRPWAPGEQVSPVNAFTRRRYRGSNLALLTATACQEGYSDPRWGGFAQIAAAGGSVRRGEKGTPVLIWKVGRKTDRDGEQREQSSDEPSSQETRRMVFASMRYVWNVEQADGLELPPAVTPPPTASWQTRNIVEEVLADTKIEVRDDPQRAAYDRDKDRLLMPAQGRFENRAAWEHTLLHELGHATMHTSRLDREDARRSCSSPEGYAVEELRAEMSAMLTGERLGVGHSPRHGEAYIASWLKALDSNPNQIRQAMGEAQRMSDWLARHIESAEEPETAGETATAGKAETATAVATAA